MFKIHISNMSPTFIFCHHLSPTSMLAVPTWHIVFWKWAWVSSVVHEWIGGFWWSTFTEIYWNGFYILVRKIKSNTSQKDIKLSLAPTRFSHRVKRFGETVSPISLPFLEVIPDWLIQISNFIYFWEVSVFTSTN